MRMLFDDGSYINVDDGGSGSVILSIGARGSENRLAMTVNSVELTKDQLITLCGKYMDGNKNDV